MFSGLCWAASCGAEACERSADCDNGTSSAAKSTGTGAVQCFSQTERRSRSASVNSRSPPHSSSVLTVISVLADIHCRLLHDYILYFLISHIPCEHIAYARTTRGP